MVHAPSKQSVLPVIIMLNIFQIGYPVHHVHVVQFKILGIKAFIQIRIDKTRFLKSSQITTMQINCQGIKKI